MIRTLLGAATAALISALAVAPAMAEPPVTTFKLDNGMDVVVIEDHRAPVVTHMVWYRVGSADEPRGTSGIAHFLEHLMFKGTDEIPDGAFPRSSPRMADRTTRSRPMITPVTSNALPPTGWNW